jgi:hypothetical protein
MKTHKVILGILLATTVTGCEAQLSQELNDGASLRVGKVKINGKGHGRPDAEIVSARIEVREIQLRKTGGEFLTFPVDPFELELLALNESTGQALARARVPNGSYDHVRLITAETGTVQLADGSTHGLSVPSGPQTGIKIFLNPSVEISSDAIHVITLSFDLSKSFVRTGHDERTGECGSFHFKPVVHTSVTAVPIVPPPPPVDDGTGENSGSGDGTGDGSSDGSGDGTGDDSGDSDVVTEPDEFYPIIGI